jgi:hypothetical protein
MIKVRQIAIIFILSAAFLTACTRDTGIKQYNKLADSELASGRRADSIFFGIYLGMPSKEFFVHCWNLNKKGLFTDGNNNTAVLYKLKQNELKFPASMNFYPEFNADKINRMLVTFDYDSWAPWNKERFSDKLLPDVVNLYKKWYPQGNEFIEMEDKEKGRKIYIKVDGNRRIIIGRYNDRVVRADYTDMLVEKQLKK